MQPEQEEQKEIPKKKKEPKIKLPRDSLQELCYNSGDSPIYGEITDGSLKKIMRIMTENLPTALYKTPIGILDIGSGSGMALCKLATLYQPYKCNLYGIEVAPERVRISDVLIPKHLPSNVGEWKVFECDVKTLDHLPQSHFSYSFDKAMSKDLMEHIERLQYLSYSLQIVATSKPKVYFARPDRWEPIGEVNASMHVSQSGVKFYLFKKMAKEKAKK